MDFKKLAFTLGRALAQKQASDPLSGMGAMAGGVGAGAMASNPGVGGGKPLMPNVKPGPFDKAMPPPTPGANKGMMNAASLYNPKMEGAWHKGPGATAVTPPGLSKATMPGPGQVGSAK